MTAKRSQMKASLPTYLNMKDIGKSLKEMGSDVVKTTHQNVVSHWYHSEMDADVIIWKDEKQNIIKQQVNLLGQVIEWNIVDGLRTGFVVETEEKAQQVRGQGPSQEQFQGQTDGKQQAANFAGPNEIQFDRNPTAASINQAIELIHFLNCISENDKEALAYNLKNAPKISSMDPRDFLKKFGREPEPSKAKGFFTKIIRRFFK